MTSDEMMAVVDPRFPLPPIRVVHSIPAAPDSGIVIIRKRSVRAMANVIAGLDERYDGSHLDFNGNAVPW